MRPSAWLLAVLNLLQLQYESRHSTEYSINDRTTVRCTYVIIQMVYHVDEAFHTLSRLL